MQQGQLMLIMGQLMPIMGADDHGIWCFELIVYVMAASLALIEPLAMFRQISSI